MMAKREITAEGRAPARQVRSVETAHTSPPRRSLVNPTSAASIGRENESPGLKPCRSGPREKSEGPKKDKKLRNLPEQQRREKKSGSREEGKLRSRDGHPTLSSLAPPPPLFSLPASPPFFRSSSFLSPPQPPVAFCPHENGGEACNRISMTIR